MERKPVTSSTMLSAGYDPQLNVFEVEFTSGAIYQFQGMSKVVYEDFRKSENKGRYFLAYIRPCYPFVRVNPAEKKEEPNASSEKAPEVPKTEKRKKAREASRKLAGGN